MKKFTIAVLLTLFAVTKVAADEGMWLLPYLEKLNIKDMRREGFRLSARDIYNINGDALKDAIVIFGGGCTGEIVSPDGLLLTNHHCGFDAIQQHSSVEHDYLKNGFWAMNRGEEIPTPGLAVTFIRRIAEVTDRIVSELADGMTEQERNARVAELIDAIVAQAKEEYPGMQISVKPFFGGNQYFMFVMERYDDVRLVGAPPVSIGKFGGDTDNWMWPRHTGDFSVFRVYSDADGRGAAYSRDNVPYKAPSHLKVSLKGVKANDFAMIIGFPGSTSRYMTSWEIDNTLDQANPIRIFVRGERQEILKKEMAASDRVRIQYASKYARSSNYWKNSIGMSRGLRKLNVRAQKAEIEDEFRAWLAADPAREAKYGRALPLIEAGIREGRAPVRVLQYYQEAILRGTEIVGFASSARAWLKADSTKMDPALAKKLLAEADELYKDYDMDTDCKVAKRMLQIIKDSLPSQYQPSIMAEVYGRFGGSVDKYIDYLFRRSMFSWVGDYKRFLRDPERVEKVKFDPALAYANSVIAVYNSLIPAAQAAQDKFAEGHRLFVAGLMEMWSGKKLYPDANFTMRLTYGRVLPYSPADAVEYSYYTTLRGVMEKEDPTNPVEFTVPARLKEIYAAKDFGPYAMRNGEMPVGFISDNDITGGNSGSPVMNARGELIGLAFDGNWEAMSGDIAFEPRLQRTISVDIRYVMLVIDKFAGAGYLLDEMTIVK